MNFSNQESSTCVRSTTTIESVDVPPREMRVIHPPGSTLPPNHPFNGMRVCLHGGNCRYGKNCSFYHDDIETEGMRAFLNGTMVRHPKTKSDNRVIASLFGVLDDRNDARAAAIIEHVEGLVSGLRDQIKTSTAETAKNIADAQNTVMEGLGQLTEATIRTAATVQEMVDNLSAAKAKHAKRIANNAAKK